VKFILQLFFSVYYRNFTKFAKNEKVTVEDVQRVDDLFMDIGEAAEYLKKYEEKMMVH
jgi:DNA helicase TIP49 (TBP-interacting protein)